jgi:hypothetical protein
MEHFLHHQGMKCGDAFQRTIMEAKMKSILDPSFRYTKSVDTDLKKTFARIRREQRNQQQQQAIARGETMRRVFAFQSR